MRCNGSQRSRYGQEAGSYRGTLVLVLDQAPQQLPMESVTDPGHP